MVYFKLILFALLWIATVYSVACLAARKLKRVNLKIALLYASTLALLGVFGEVTIDSAYKFAFGHLFWVYTILPVHHGYTSRYAIFLWGIYGFAMYLLHDHTGKAHKIKITKWLPYQFMATAIIFEAAVNLSFRAMFGRLIFYYFPNDLWHLTSIQVLPFYLLGGYVMSASLNHAKSYPTFYSVGGVLLGSVFVFLA